MNLGVRTLKVLAGKRTGNEKVAAIIVELEPGADPGVSTSTRGGREHTPPSRGAEPRCSQVKSKR